MTFSSLGFEVHHKQTRRERFLSEMDVVIPWQRLCALIEPHYPSGQRGRPPIGIERMLRIYFLQQWFNMSDPQAEDCLYDSEAMRRFVGIDLCAEPGSDETTIYKFRHLIEEHGLGKPILAAVNEHLKKHRIKTATARLWMQQSLLLLTRPRIMAARVIQRCIRRRKVISGILA